MTAAPAFYPPGATPTVWRAGDFILTKNLAPWHTRQGFLSALIRLGEWLRFRRYRTDTFTPWEWNHAVGVGDGHLIEALGHGVVTSPLDKYRPVEFWYVATDLDGGERADCAAYWQTMVGTPYGYVTVVCAGLRLVTRLPVGFTRTDRCICSGLVAAGLGVYRWRSNPAFVSPAELAIYHGVRAA